MAQFTVLSTGGSRSSTSEFEVHARGCRDVALKLRDRMVYSWDIDAESAEALVAEEVATYADQDQGWTADDHRILPCALKAGTK